MTTASSFLNLKKINSQMAVLVIASILTLHLIVTSIFLLHRPNSPEFPAQTHDQLATVVQLLGTAPVSERPALLMSIERTFPRLTIKALPNGLPADAMELPVSFEPHSLHRHLGPNYRVFALTQGGPENRIGIKLPDGTAISAVVDPDHYPPPFWRGPVTMMLLSAVICVTLLSLWAARALTAPLSSFAKAAENFSLNAASTTLPERGPEEIRAVARALNRMRHRITGLMDDRTRMLAAISHDLRTPITRIRLRSEFINDETTRERMVADLDQMLSMLESVLSFLRNDRKADSMTLVDVTSILQLVTDQFADMGHKVSYRGPDHAMAMTHPDDLHRAITNLVENAVRFGAEITIGLTLSADAMTIDVADDGPGISNARKAEMMEPFVRGDEARNMNESAGFGLGLSIARTIAIGHGGTLSLHDRSPHGLIVRIELPLHATSERNAA